MWPWERMWNFHEVRKTPDESKRGNVDSWMGRNWKTRIWGSIPKRIQKQLERKIFIIQNGRTNLADQVTLSEHIWLTKVTLSIQQLRSNPFLLSNSGDVVDLSYGPLFRIEQTEYSYINSKPELKRKGTPSHTITQV